MKLLLPLLLLCAPLHARDVTLAWDANPTAELVNRYYVEGFVGGVWVTLGQTISPTPGPVYSSPPLELNLPNFPDTTTRVRAFAANASGVSDPSDELVVLAKPTKPGQLRIKVSLQKTVGGVSGMSPWENLYVHEETASGASFFRTIVEPMTP